MFKLFLVRVMLLWRRRPPLSSLASSHCRARSDGQDQDRPPLAATPPLRAHLASPCARARVLHAQSPPYLPGLPRMTPPSFSSCAPTLQSHALCRPTSPPHLVVPPPSPCRLRCRPRQARGTASLSPRTYHPPPTSLLLLLAQPPTSYLCPLRWPTHRPHPPPYPPAHPGRLATLFTRAHASRDSLRVRAEAAVDDDAGCDGGRGRGGASARRAARNNHGVLRIRAAAATRVVRVRCLMPGSAPGGKIASDGGSCRRRRMATPAWARQKTHNPPQEHIAPA